MLQFVRLGRIENCGRIVPTTLANPLHTPAGHDALKDVQPEANDFTTHTHTHTNTFHTPAGLRFCVRWTTRSSRAFPSENGTTVYFPATPNRCGAQRALLARIRPLLLLLLLLLWSLTIYCCAGHHHHQPTPLLLTFDPGKHRTQCKHFALCFAQAHTNTLTHSWLLFFCGRISGIYFH